eukprot:4854468-Alexandrium_andersonii.AAC.1
MDRVGQSRGWAEGVGSWSKEGWWAEGQRGTGWAKGCAEGVWRWSEGDGQHGDGGRTEWGRYRSQQPHVQFSIVFINII